MTRRGQGTSTAASEPLGPRVWLVLHPTDSDYEKNLRTTLSRRASQLGMDLVTRRSSRRRMTADGNGTRPINILEPADAGELYRDLSLRKCHVLSRGAVFVLHDPRRDPPTKRDCLPLPQFVQYKAAFRTLEDGRDPAADLDDLMALEGPSDCSDHHDPRVLPLHVFHKDAVLRPLVEESGRQAFRSTYGNGGNWLSPSTGTWTPAAPGVRHGRPDASGNLLRVWDYVVPPGFHWDTSAGRKRRTVIAASSVWRVEPRGYVNVYPNAHVRAGARANELWQAKR